MKSLFERWPGISAIWAQRIIKRFDQNRVEIEGAAVQVNEPIRFRRRYVISAGR
uniref:Uncharacterized protein n=1 Tax=Lotus japonicus TaxID=34305 RepID=I3SEP7_LOTJA|nr:unknown [Lotus japonicus]